MEDGRKRQLEHDISGEYLCKKARSPAFCDDGNSDSEDIFACLSVMDEERVGELMKLLDKEVTSPVAKVKFIDDPYSSASIFKPYSSYVTINGNEESCGSSFSDSDSSVMVSIDVGGVLVNNGGCGGSFAFGAIWGFQAVETAARSEEEVVARYLVTEEDGEKSVNGMNGCDSLDLEDAMLARFLGEDLF